MPTPERRSLRVVLPAVAAICAFNFALIVVSSLLVIGYMNGQNDEIEQTAQTARRVALTQAASDREQRAAIQEGCLRAELGRQETNLRGDIQRKLWLGAAEQRDADAAAAADPEVAAALRERAAFYRAQIGRMADAPALVPNGWKLPKAELREVAKVACEEAYGSP